MGVNQGVAESAKSSSFFPLLLRLTRSYLNLSPWLTHKSALFYLAQVHDTTVYHDSNLAQPRFVSMAEPTSFV